MTAWKHASAMLLLAAALCLPTATALVAFADLPAGWFKAGSHPAEYGPARTRDVPRPRPTVASLDPARASSRPSRRASPASPATEPGGAGQRPSSDV
jgi:hypothetical protein